MYDTAIQSTRTHTIFSFHLIQTTRTTNKVKQFTGNTAVSACSTSSMVMTMKRNSETFNGMLNAVYTTITDNSNEC